MFSNEFISKYETFFQNRLFNNLPESSKGVIISNIDFVICNYLTKKFIIIELKTHWKQMESRQKWLYNMLHKRLKYSDKIDDRSFEWTYCITFDWEDFLEPVTIKWTNIKEKQVDEVDLKNILYFLIS